MIIPLEDDDDEDDEDEYDEDDGYPANSHHDKFPPWWEFVRDDYGGILSPDKFPPLMIMMKNYKMNTLKIFFGILLPFLTQISEL